MKKKLRSTKTIVAMCALFLGLSSAAVAQTYDWVGGVSSDFYNAANWTSTQGPVAFDDSSFKFVRTHQTNGHAPVISSTMPWQPGVFDNTAGDLIINANFNVFYNDKLNGNVTVNQGAYFTCRNIMRIGREGTGILNVYGTAWSNNTDTWQGMFIGALAGGNGTVNVFDGGFVSGGYNMEVGTRNNYPTGTLNVNAGGTSDAFWATVVGPNGTINVNGGTVNTGQVLFVGDLFVDNQGTEGTLGAVVGKININSGSVIINHNDLAAPDLAMHANAKIIIDNGSLAIKRTGVDFTAILNNFINTGQIEPAPGKALSVNYNGIFTTVTASPVASSKNANKNNFSVYPNPATDIVTIKGTENFSGSLNVAVVNMLGETVMQSQLSELNNYKLNITHLAAGMYAVKVNNGTQTATSKIIKR
ncbi:T9SS type A sorting domain-containing protein [Flavobacterium sp. Sd200]|uniref:T9SS type A sorting domain-containing protein n=1 Tax=Flavobacterium sp. Sd200 TaxID=2692211 RepID=UPI0013715B50|nr:T9SS type A sorting domain-containing protein [Flavobacterium sp. Sd200]MXN89889.1 T9SS type A sorting domain-containing protein [Flavobacterium sp. Sd200]